MDPPPPSTAIRKATEDCRHCLEECVLVPRLMDNEWAENRTVDFNLWIAGIGALAGKNASLDARLSSQPETNLVVVNLLIMLKIFLERCKALASQDVEPEILHSPPIDQESEPVTLSRRSSLSSQSSPGRPLTSLSQISSSRSADIGEFDELSGSGSSNASETDDAKPSSALAQARRNAETTLDNLTMVAFAIRRSGTSSRLLKADATFNPDSEEFLRLRNQLTLVLFAENQVSIAMKESAEKILDGLAAFSKDASTMSKVQQRLIEACLRRYNRFRYAQTHATKLGTVHKVQLPEPTSEPRLPDQPPLPKDQPPGPLPARQPKPQQPRVLPAARNGGVISETMASEAASALHQKLLGNCTPSQQSNTAISINASRLQYPSPPKVHSDQQNFRCPCCCQTLPRIVLERRKWRKHISEDLSPYTCILDGCSIPEVLYITRDAWLNHIQKDHSTNIWICVLCDTSESFPNSEDFTEHIKSEHHETITNDEIATILSMCLITSPGTISSCPLCGRTDAELGKPVEPNSLLDHIAEHIHLFSLRSLPWPPLGEEIKRTAIAHSGGESYIKIWLDKQLSQPPSDEPGEEHKAITGTVVKKHLEKASSFFASSAQDMCTDIDEKPTHEDYFYDNAYFGDSTRCSSIAGNQKDLDDEMPEVRDIWTDGSENLSAKDQIDQDLLDRPKVFLLSLDGGGMRGLSMLLVLKELMTQVNQSLGSADIGAIKPCRVFDLIAGTGVGGLIAIMLGRLEMDVDECISALNRLMFLCFKSKSSLSGNHLSLAPRDETKSFASAQLAILQSAILELITSHGISASQQLNNGSLQECRVFVCATEIFAEKPTRLRSYSLPIHDDLSATIFEAALATVVSSMEDYFPPVQIGTIKFAGGELSDNNPVREVYEEASKMWYHKPGDPKSVPRCLVSIGVGGQTPIDIPYYEILRRSIMETKKTAFWLEQSEPDYSYFRFDVDQGLQDVGLNESESYGTIVAATLEYLERQRNEFNRCLSELYPTRRLASQRALAITTSVYPTRRLASQRALAITTSVYPDCRVARNKLHAIQFELRYAHVDGLKTVFPIEAVRKVLSDDNMAERVFRCRCHECFIHSQRSAEDRHFDPASLLGNFAPTFALLIYIFKAGLIRHFQDRELYFLGQPLTPGALHFITLLQLPEGASHLATIKEILSQQYMFYLRQFDVKYYLQIITSPEALPIYEEQEEVGRGAYGYVHSFKIIPGYAGAGYRRVKGEKFVRKIFIKRNVVAGKREFDNLLRIYQKATSREDNKFYQHIIEPLAGYDYGKTFFIVFPFAEMTLAQYLKGEGDHALLDAKHIWEQMEGLAGALSFLHEPRTTNIGTNEVAPSRVYHFDLKPANILIRDGIVMLADFGQSKFKPLSEEDSSLGVLNPMRAFNYGPPENNFGSQSLGEGNISDYNFDIWSLGGIFSEVITLHIYGSAGVEKYRVNRRRDEVQSGQYSSITFFLDRENVKPSVTTQHVALQLEIRDNPRSRDIWLESFANDNLFKLIDDMLSIINIKMNIQRPRAQKVQERLSELRIAARKAAAQPPSRPQPVVQPVVPDLWSQARAGSFQAVYPQTVRMILCLLAQQAPGTTKQCVIFMQPLKNHISRITLLWQHTIIHPIFQSVIPIDHRSTSRQTGAVINYFEHPAILPGSGFPGYANESHAAPFYYELIPVAPMLPDNNAMYFRSPIDTFAFQAALTGQHVLLNYSAPIQQATIKRSNFFSSKTDLINPEAILQVWCDTDLPLAPAGSVTSGGSEADRFGFSALPAVHVAIITKQCLYLLDAEHTHMDLKTGSYDLDHNSIVLKVKGDELWLDRINLRPPGAIMVNIPEPKNHDKVNEVTLSLRRAADVAPFWEALKHAQDIWSAAYDQRQRGKHRRRR